MKYVKRIYLVIQKDGCSGFTSEKVANHRISTTGCRAGMDKLIRFYVTKDMAIQNFHPNF